MRIALFVTASAALLAVSPSVSIAQVERDRYRSGRVESEFAPPIDVWLDQISYDRGAHMRPYFSTEPGAYVVIVRVSSDGELRVMYPSRPGEQKPYVVGQMTNDRIPYRGDPAFRLYESSGTGFVFAIASYQRFDFSYFTQGRSWSTARLAAFGRYGDPFQVLRNFVDRILPESAEFSLDYEVYDIYLRGHNGVYASDIYGGGIYGSRYGYNSLSDFHNSCITAFGFRYSSYCRSFNGGYYGPIVISPPRRRSPKGEKMGKPRPVVPDPVVTEPGPVGTQPIIRSDERAARQRYERMRQQMETRSPGKQPIMASPRVDRQPNSDTREREPIIYRTAPTRSEPRSQPRSEPRPMEGRQPVRAMPSAPARVEVRNEPRAAPQPRSEPRARERAKEN